MVSKLHLNEMFIKRKKIGDENVVEGTYNSSF